MDPKDYVAFEDLNEFETTILFCYTDLLSTKQTTEHGYYKLSTWVEIKTLVQIKFRHLSSTLETFLCYNLNKIDREYVSIENQKRSEQQKAEMKAKRK